MRRRLAALLAPLAVLSLAAAVGAGAAPNAPNVPAAARVVRAAAPLGLASGPDVSSHQHNRGRGISWGQVAQSGRAFAVVKATEGSSYTNPWFKRDWAGIRGAGMVRATYHYARPTLPLSTAADQARRFVRTVGPRKEQGTLPLVLDIEEAGRLTPAQLQAWTRLFLTTTEQLSGRTPMIYTYPYFWRVQMGNSREFTRYPLWIASYGTARPPDPLPGGWPSWTLWQYSARGLVDGVRGIVDVNVFCCSTTALATLADATSSPITEKWASLGGESGLLGAPTSPEIAVGPGRFRDYLGGSVYWTRGTGAHVLTGAVLERYRGLDGPRSILGFPFTDAMPVDGVSGASHAVFSGGRLYAGLTDAVAWLLPAGPVLDDWLARGGALGPLGLPVGDVLTVTGGTAGTFAGGQLVSSIGGTTPERGTHELHGGVLAAWQQAGGADSVYGLPSSDVYAVPGGQRADFGPLSIEVAGS